MEKEEITDFVGPLRAKGLSDPEIFAEARNQARDYTYKLKKEGRISFSEPELGEVPSIYIVRRTVPEAWEDITMALAGIGQEVHTYYDPVNQEGKFTSFPSMEATVLMHIQDIFGEPRFHKGFLGGALGFGDYRAEIEGVKDSWMISPEIVADMIKKGKFDEIREDSRWKYTYHQRIYSYPFLDITGEPRTVNQIDSVIKKFKREPLSKSAQAVTWDPRWDHNDGQMGVKWHDYDSPCLQRLWFRMIPFKDGYKLNINEDFRSRCHFKAVPMNKDGIGEGIHKHVREQLQDALGVPIYMGRNLDKSDSLHLYGHYFDTIKQGNDANRAMNLIFRIASGESIEKRVVLPGTSMHDYYLETIAGEYKQRKDNPNFGRS